MIRAGFSILLMVIALNGCGSIEQDVGEKDHALDLLNQRDYEGAITLLEKLHNEFPSDDEVTLLLASAYSGSVGLNVVDAFDIFKPILFRDDRGVPKAKKPVSEVVKSGNDGDLSRTLERRLVRFLDDLSDGFALLFGLPYTESISRNRMVEALLIVKTIGSSSDYYLRARAYSTLLNVSQFLNYARDAFPGLQGTKDDYTAVDLMCAFEPYPFFNNLAMSLKYLADGLEDVQIAAELKEMTVSPKLEDLRQSAQNLNLTYNENQGPIAASDLIFATVKKPYCD